MGRSLTLGNLLSTKFKTFSFENKWLDAFGEPEKKGIWLIWGNEKNGKTWFALMLGDYLSKFEKVLYVSAEEGINKSLIDCCKRANLSIKNRSLQFEKYLPIQELDEKLSQRKSARIVIIDNMTIYQNELKNGVFRDFTNKHSKKLFVFLAHEDRKQPYTSTAKLAQRLATIIIYVQGMKCFISGRCPGGTFIIDKEKAALYHGEEIKSN